jgi:hypothetical protein
MSDAWGPLQAQPHGLDDERRQRTLFDTPRASAGTPPGARTLIPSVLQAGSEDPAGDQREVCSERIARISSIDESSASSTLGSKCLPRSRDIHAIVDSSDHAWR